MPLYKRKPIINTVEAIQFFPNQNRLKEIATFLEKSANIQMVKGQFGQPLLQIVTKDGQIVLAEKSYIIKGEKGDIYGCKHDDFESLYEKKEQEV